MANNNFDNNVNNVLIGLKDGSFSDSEVYEIAVMAVASLKRANADLVNATDYGYGDSVSVDTVVDYVSESADWVGDFADKVDVGDYII